ncbi:hypothetical protein BDU57DRAFT_517046 [Ampelomyces quisqualis]|uniref:Pathogen-related protein n=1 Tax=Ampelomyces quisqualis TaxID=50730 RepID=A0A6A5QN24_AMPQU|nr:hypothetical protein BDU57DRAFT_517046 [Ampelomyces quisqualis]
MAAADVQQPPAEAAAPALPDYLTSPDATLGDKEAQWRYGRAPDYSKTRKMFAETKQMKHEAGSLPELVQNLVKNWEVEASFKPSLDDWRTIDRENYSFAINGSEPQGAENMLEVGTYNAIIAPNEYYDPTYSSFSSSHKTFKRMMPTFAWEVLEVYSGPPTVSFRWRHWGVMKNDYVGINNRGEKVTAKAHGGAIDIQGVTVASVNDKVQLQAVRTWFDPLDMFRQIAPQGVVKKEVVKEGLSAEDVVEQEQVASGVVTSAEQELPDHTVQSEEEAKKTTEEIDRKEREGETLGMPVPAGHAEVGEGGGCPMGFR